MIPLCFRRMHHVFYYYTIEPQEYVKNFVYFIFLFICAQRSRRVLAAASLL